jgi:ABC-type bacteriocin/lantibiotic exporter with double-glycine peptidase domain
MDRLTLVGMAAVAAGAIVVYAIFKAGTRTVIDAVRDEAKTEAVNEILQGAENVAAAANESLAIASDPNTLDATLAAGQL